MSLLISNPAELYDLTADIGEQNNLSADMPGKTMELRKMLYDWRSVVDARMMSPNPAYKKK